MKTQFSENIISLKNLKNEPEKVLKHIQKNHKPLLLTNEGQELAVLQSIDDYEDDEEEKKFMKAIAKGLLDVKEGRKLDIEKVKPGLNMINK